MAAVLLLSSTASAALQSIKDRTAPSPPSQQTHGCMTGTAGPQGQWSAALGASQAGSAVLAFHVLMAAYLVGGSASQGREAEELLWITDPLGICSFPVAAFSEVRS